MGTLEIDRLTKMFEGDNDDIVAVSDLDITIENGEFLVLVGPSGCGKSTTLRCVAGLESVSSGSIVLDDERVTNRQPKERNMAMVFQNYALYPHMTARENMAFGLRMTTDLSKEEIDERVKETAEMMGIHDLLNDRPDELSGGQQQRVALGRAIVREPEVFLMDEPLSNLDAKLRTQMRTELQELQQRLNVTTIYVTHDQTEAMTMSDRIAVLNDGELQQIGTPLECYYEPENRFVADFIGEPSMNFFDLAVDDSWLVGDELRYELPESHRDAVTGCDTVTLGIRPEDIEIVEDCGHNTFRGTVEVVEPIGDQNFLHLGVQGHEVTAAVAGEYDVVASAQVLLHIPAASIYLFDTETGDAMINCERHGAPIPTVTDTAGSELA